MRNPKQMRQGDVFIERVACAPDGIAPVERDNGRLILAYGEVTGDRKSTRLNSSH